MIISKKLFLNYVLKQFRNFYRRLSCKFPKNDFYHDKGYICPVNLLYNKNDRIKKYCQTKQPFYYECN